LTKDKIFGEAQPHVLRTPCRIRRLECHSSVVRAKLTYLGRSVHRFGGASTIFTPKTDDLFSRRRCFDLYTFSLMTVFTFGPPMWWLIESPVHLHTVHIG